VALIGGMPGAGRGARPRHLSLLLLLSAAGCGESERQSLEVVAQLDRERPGFGTVLVTGFSPAWQRRLANVDGAPDWTTALAIRAAPPGAGGDVPSLAGRYRFSEDGVLRFEPRYPPSGGLEYRVGLDPAGLATIAGRVRSTEPAREWSFAVPVAAPLAPTTEIVAVHPSSPVVPANQLRWYVEFNAPMQAGEALHHVRLLDEEGVEVAGAFLDPVEELWDPEGRRLTMLFDMGRVKHGIRTRMEQGPVLHAGRRYRLRIDSSWPDARGAPLRGGFERGFVAGPPDHTQPDPSAWPVRVPVRGSREALEVRFGEPLDHALAERLVAVFGPEGAPVPGRGAVLKEDRGWRFVPRAPWAADRHELRVGAALEDLAGNSVARVFDADLADGRTVRPSGGQAGGRSDGQVVRAFVPR
jgi:hypothetical protein